MRMGTCVTCLCALKMWLWVSVVLYDNSLWRLLSGEGAKVRLVVSFIALFTRVGWGSGLYVRVMLYVTQPSVRACVLLWAGWVCVAKLYLYVVMFWFLCSQVVLAGVKYVLWRNFGCGCKGRLLFPGKRTDFASWAKLILLAAARVYGRLHTL